MVWSSWRSILRTGTAEEVALAVLERLDLDSPELLLAIEDTERASLLGHFHQVGLAALREAEINEELAERIRADVGWMAESLLEVRGHYRPAAAIYALVHDERSLHPDRRFPLERAWVRFRLANALWSLAEDDPDTVRSCADFVRRTLPLLDSLWARLEGDAKQTLRDMTVHLNAWLGRRWESLEEHRLAEDAYSQAAICTDLTDDRVAYQVHAAGALAKQGEHQKAYDRLCFVQDQLDCAEDHTRELWEALYGRLREYLGGRMNLDDRGVRTSVPRDLAAATEQILEFGVLSEPQQLRSMIDLAREEIAAIPDHDAARRHEALRFLAFLLVAASGRSAEADELMGSAEALESRFDDERPKLERQILNARMRFHAGDAQGAVALFKRTLSRAEHIFAPEERLAFTGHFLEALGLGSTGPEPDVTSLGQLADLILDDFTAVLSRQPSAAARRRARERFQRILEAAILSLASAAHQLELEAPGAQRALSQAWTLIMAGRNVELARPREPAVHDDCRRRLRELENAFHVELRQASLTGATSTKWHDRLDAVFEHELSMRMEQHRVEVADLRPPAEGVAVAFFEVHDLTTSHPLIILAHHEGKLHWHVLEQDAGDSESSLASWAQRRGLADSARNHRGRRDLRRAEAQDGDTDLASAPGFTDLLPPQLRLLPTRELPSLMKSQAENRDLGRRPMFPLPWTLFTDGVLSLLPVEALPDRSGDQVRFGQNRAVRLALRPSVPPAVDRPVDLARGWLGLGGVPAAGGVEELPGALDEVRKIERLLAGRGLPGSTITGIAAHAEALKAELQRLRPAVLHLAVHGIADDNYPDACTLILAAAPERAERELLPYRRIAELPLADVELVVLSACSSLVGRSDRSASMEGLAWAFLRAGVPQVIASRYPVDDHATATLMLELYRQLETLPVAEALGRARDICLTSAEVPHKEVAAWSVWC